MAAGRSKGTAQRPVLEPLEARLLLGGAPAGKDAALPCSLAEDAEYLLITSESLTAEGRDPGSPGQATTVNGFQPLVDYRAAQGRTSKLVTVEWIDATYDGARPDGGADLQTKIRNCIIDHWANHGTEFVCLGGDENVIPVRFCWTGSRDNTLTELYYADTNGGSWDLDGDGLYGEPEDVDATGLVPDVHLGRVPVRTGEQALDYAEKVQRYEATDPDGFANSMIVVAAGEPMPGDERPDDFREYDPVCGGIGLTRFYRNEIQPYWQAVPFDSFYRTYTSWDQSVCGDYAANAGHLREKLSEGYHHVVYSGHAMPDGWVLEGSNFADDIAAALTNTSRLSVVWSGGCSAAGFNHSARALCEAFLRNPDGGAVVFLGWAETTYNADHRYQTMREVFQNGRRCIGEAFTAAKTALAGGSRYHQYMYVLLGDPAITILGDEGGRKLQIASPAGCEVIDLGTDLTIRWNATGTDFAPDEKVMLEYSDDSGATWQAVPGAEQLDYDAGLFEWLSPSLAAGAGYRVRVTSLSDPQVSASPRTDFTVHPLGLLTVESAPIRGVKVLTDAGLPYTLKTDYTLTVKLGDTVTLTAPSLGDQNFVGWQDAHGALLCRQLTYSFPLGGDGLVVAAYEAPGGPRDYYVNDELGEEGFAAGDDDNDGQTPQTPLRLIQSVLDRYADIAAIHVSAGTYTEGIVIGAGDAGLALIGAGSDVTRIDPQQGGRCVRLDGFTSGRIIGLTLANGSAADGGAVWCDDSSPEIADCAFVGNQAGDYGGAVYLQGSSSPTFARCLFLENRAWRGGAVRTREEAAPTFDSCLFVGNSATSKGGALFCTGGSAPAVRSCFFGANSSHGEGGAVACLDLVELAVVGSSFSGNVSTARGGAMCIAEDVTAEVTTSILWGNAAPEGEEIRLADNATLALSYCDAEGGAAAVFRDAGTTLEWGLDNLAVAPLFARDPDDGGDGWGVGDNDDYGDLHLTSDSPCINAGDPDGDYSGQTDMDHQPRVAYGRVDIGADEFILFGDATLDAKVDHLDYLTLKRHFGTAEGAGWRQADLDGDGSVGYSDYAAMRDAVGQTFVLPPSAPASEEAGILAPQPPGLAGEPPTEETAGAPTSTDALWLSAEAAAAALREEAQVRPVRLEAAAEPAEPITTPLTAEPAHAMPAGSPRPAALTAEEIEHRSEPVLPTSEAGRSNALGEASARAVLTPPDLAVLSLTAPLPVAV